MTNSVQKSRGDLTYDVGGGRREAAWRLQATVYGGGESVYEIGR
jgi:hypothetical protein